MLYIFQQLKRMIIKDFLLEGKFASWKKKLEVAFEIRNKNRYFPENMSIYVFSHTSIFVKEG